MALDYIICNNDMIQITPTPPMVCPSLSAPVPLVASGFSTVNNMAVCLEGDELPPALKSPVPYMSPPFVTPGMVSVSITLQPSNKTQVAQDSGKPMLLKGQTFQVKFSVQSPAMQPTPTGPVPDPVSQKMGTAQFITTNTIAQAE
jgi:hypothetical protein